MLVSSVGTAVAILCCLIISVSLDRSDTAAADIGVKQ